MSQRQKDFETAVMKRARDLEAEAEEHRARMTDAELEAEFNLYQRVRRDLRTGATTVRKQMAYFRDAMTFLEAAGEAFAAAGQPTIPPGCIQAMQPKIAPLLKALGESAPRPPSRFQATPAPIGHPAFLRRAIEAAALATPPRPAAPAPARTTWPDDFGAELDREERARAAKQKQKKTG